MKDSTKIWWDLRPSAKYPTLETRIMDVCTRIDGAISLGPYCLYDTHALPPKNQKSTLARI